VLALLTDLTVSVSRLLAQQGSRIQDLISARYGAEIEIRYYGWRRRCGAASSTTG
jgi:hypothetical protein